MPGLQLKGLEQAAQECNIVQSGRHQANRMFCARGQGRGGGGVFAGKVVEDHRLADVRAADNCRHQQRRQIELGEKLVFEQLEPLFFSGAATPTETAAGCKDTRARSRRFNRAEKDA